MENKKRFHPTTWTKALILSIGDELFSLRSLLYRSLNCLGNDFSICGLCLTATASLLSCLRCFAHVLIEVNKFDESHLCSITLTCTQLDDTCITTRTVSYLLCYFTKENLDDFLVLQITENYTT